MKAVFFPLSFALFALCGCRARPEIAAALPPKPAAKPIAAATVAPTQKPIIVFSGRPSLPTMPQPNSSPRPTFIPLPTPTYRPGQPIVVSNGPTPTPRESPTLTVSNAPIAGTDIKPQAAAARRLVWADTKTLIYYFPVSRLYGATGAGYYLSEEQAQKRGFRAASR